MTFRCSDHLMFPWQPSRSIENSFVAFLMTILGNSSLYWFLEVFFKINFDDLYNVRWGFGETLEMQDKKSLGNPQVSFCGPWRNNNNNKLNFHGYSLFTALQKSIKLTRKEKIKKYIQFWTYYSLIVKLRLSSRRVMQSKSRKIEISLESGSFQNPWRDLLNKKTEVTP